MVLWPSCQKSVVDPMDIPSPDQSLDVLQAEIAVLRRRIAELEGRNQDLLNACLGKCGDNACCLLRDENDHLHNLIERLQMSLQVAKVGVWDWDIVNNVLIWDDVMYQLYGVSRDAFTGAYDTWVNGLHPDDVERCEHEIKLALEGQKPFISKFRVRWPDGSVHHIKVFSIIERDADGTPCRMRGTNWDITAEHDALVLEKEHSRVLVIKNQELEEFAYVASHDLQEPARAVLNMSRILCEDYEGLLDDDGLKLVGHVQDAALRMRQLVTDLLDYALIGRDRTSSMVDCAKISQEIEEDLMLLIQEADATLEVGNLPVVMGYETELRMLFQNLISNAIKFRRPDVKPVVTLRAEIRDNNYVFTVTDNGIGIQQEHLERIFAIFQRLHGRHEFDGTGIGLAQCRKVAQLHGGTITAKSTVGEGSTFTVIFPVLS